MTPMLLLAATTMEKLQQVPLSTWLKILGGFVLFLILLAVAKMVFERINKFILFTIAFVAVMIIWLTQLGEQNIFERWSNPSKADPVAPAKPAPPPRK